MSSVADIDVVIVNYNSGQALQQNIKFLTQGAGKKLNLKLNVWIVDNDSSDQSVSLIKNLNPKQVQSTAQNIQLIQNDSNVGFAVASNQGAGLGAAKQIAFINPDCFITGEQLLHLSQVLTSHTEAALIGCRVLNEDGSLQAASRRRLPTFWRIIWHLTGLSRFSMFKGININDAGKSDTLQQVEAVNGSCIMINRTAFELLGGYDEAFPLHFEDLDLFARIKTAQKDLLYDSSVEVTHLKGHSEQSSQLIKSWKRQGLLRYMLKHRPNWEYQITKFFLGSK